MAAIWHRLQVEVLRDLGSVNAERRARAASALGELGYDAEPAAELLANRLGDEDTAVRQAAIGALQRIGPGALPALALYLTDGALKWEVEEVLRGMARGCLSRLAALRASTNDKAVLERIDALLARGAPAIPALLSATAQGSVEIGSVASKVLRGLGPIAVPHIAAAIRSEQDRLRLGDGEEVTRLPHAEQEEAGRALSRIVSYVDTLSEFGEAATGELLAMLRESLPDTVRRHAEGGCSCASAEHFPQVLELLEAKDENLSRSGVRILQAMGVAAAPALVKMFQRLGTGTRAENESMAEAIAAILAALLASNGVPESVLPALPGIEEIGELAASMPGRQQTQMIFPPLPPVGAVSAYAYLLAAHAKRRGMPADAARCAAMIQELLRRADCRNEVPSLLAALRTFGDGGLAMLKALAEESNPHCRYTAASGLQALGLASLPALPLLVSLLADDDPDTQQAAALAVDGFRQAGEPAAVRRGFPALSSVLAVLPKAKSRELCRCRHMVVEDDDPSPLKVAIWVAVQSVATAGADECQLVHRALSLVALTLSTGEDTGLEGAITLLEADA